MTIEEQLLASPNSKEALAWLEGGAPGSRTLGELPTTEASLGLVKELYAARATQVTAAKIDTYGTGEENTGKLIVILPTDAAAREKLFAWCAEWAERQGFDPERDSGQEHLFVMLD